MRTAFARTLVELAAADDRIFLVIGDVGFGVVDPFVERFPERFLNVGVAEANLASVSAGLALSGFIPFMYSIGNFPTLRCVEQIRNDICYNGANVKIVCVGAGFAYGALGATHHATEDLAIMRALPGMTVVSPADPVETTLATRAASAHEGPVYLRIGRSGDPVVHSTPPPFRLGRAIEVRAGRDATVFSTGSMVHTALTAAELLERSGVSIRVVSMHTIRPLDRDAIRMAVQSTGALFSVEEHRLAGGLGGAIAEVLADDRLTPRLFRRLALPDDFEHAVGGRDYLLARAGLSVEAIANTIRATLAD